MSNYTATLTNSAGTTKDSANSVISAAELGTEFDAIQTAINSKVNTTDLGTNVATFLATPSSANLAAALTDETGTGANVFATSPTLVTPILGVATCTSLNGHTFTAGSSTFTGTAGQTYTFPSTTGTLAKAGANSDITSLSALTAISTTGGIDIKGTNTNDAAAAGDVGEYIESTAGPTNAPATATWGEITSIALTAGDWDVDLIALVTNNGATVQSCNAGIGTASGNDATGVVAGDTRADGGATSATSDLSLTVPTKRVSLAGAVTYYLKVSAAYTAGTPQFTGRISARRVR